VLFAADPAPASAGSNGAFMIVTIILLVGVMYFLMIRPQNKKRREAMQMQSQLGPGDEVQTVGGMFATVVSVDDDGITLEAAPGVEIRYARGAIARVVNSVEREPEPESDESGPASPIEQA
jgi:preprotein translocase subunit YajC